MRENSNNFKDLRPWHELDETSLKVLRRAYRHLRETSEPISGEVLRYECDVDYAYLDHLKKNYRLLAEDSFFGSNDRWVPTPLGLLYLDEALDDLALLDRALEFATNRYRPGNPNVDHDELLATLNVDEASFSRIRSFLSGLGFSFGGTRSAPTLSLFESSYARGGLRARIAKAVESIQGPRQVVQDTEPAAFTTRLHHLRIRRFRALKSVEIALSPLTVLVGPNGVGKSTVLDTFRFLSTALREGPRNAARIAGGLDRLRSAGERGPIELALTMSLDFGDDHPTPCEYAFSLDDPNGALLVEREELRVGSEQVIDGRRGKARVHLDGKTQERFHAPQALLLSSGDLSGHPVTQGLSDALSRVVLIDRNAIRDQQFVFGAATRETHSIDEIIGPIVNDARLVTKLGALLHALVPSIESIDRVVEQPGQETLRIHEHGLALPLRLDEISAGTRQLLILCALQLHTRPPTILLIEEPEAGVHPGAIPGLVDLLRSLSQRMNVIVTTHAAHLIQALDFTNEIIALERAAEGVRARPLADALKSSAWLAAFGSPAEAFVRASSEHKP